MKFFTVHHFNKKTQNRKPIFLSLSNYDPNYIAQMLFDENQNSLYSLDIINSSWYCQRNTKWKNEITL